MTHQLWVIEENEEVFWREMTWKNEEKKTNTDSVNSKRYVTYVTIT